MKDYVSEFIKCLESIDYTKRNYDVFQDFLTVSSYDGVDDKYSDEIKNYLMMNILVY